MKISGLSLEFEAAQTVGRCNTQTYIWITPTKALVSVLQFEYGCYGADRSCKETK